MPGKQVVKALGQGDSVCQKQEVGRANVFGEISVNEVARVCRARRRLAEPKLEVGEAQTTEKLKGRARRVSFTGATGVREDFQAEGRHRKGVLWKPRFDDGAERGCC